MKKFIFILCAILCIVFLFSCSIGGDSNGDTNGNNNVDNNEDNNGVKRNAFDYAVETIAGDELTPIHLKAEQIEKMKGNISKLIELENGIFKVCQLQKNGVYAYVIEFENENDALKLCEEREGKGMYVWCEGNVAVYGNNEVIKSLK